MHNKRPINLNIRTIHFPITAISSIFHRISGIVVFLIIGILLKVLDLSLSSPEGFNYIINMMSTDSFKLISCMLFTIITYHIISGIRYLLMDFGYLKQTLIVGKIVSILIFIIAIIFFILLWIKI